MVTIYLPTVAKSMDDLVNSYDLLKPLKDNNYDVGLMLLMFNGRKGLEEDKEKIYRNFRELNGWTGERKFPVIIMASNMPLEDLDFYHRPEASIEHIKELIDFTKSLPNSKDHVVTFHLNTLFSPTEWEEIGKSADEKYKFFEQEFQTVWKHISELSNYAKENNVELKIETCPVPEFGDCEDERNKLGNPYPLFSHRGFQEARSSGVGIVLDLCHTFTLYCAVPLLSELGNNFYDIYKGISPSDIKHLQRKNIMQDVNALQKGDVVHLNDSKDLFMSSKDFYHKEGVSLGKGEIINLPEIIKACLDKHLRIVFEINETDYKNRPNLCDSIEYFLQNS